jgi:adenosylmethionine-8-amino-7-oxononanoate aminotransferase
MFRAPIATRQTDAMSTDVATDSSRLSFVPNTNPMPLIVGGAGSYLHTATGDRILDAGGGAIVANIGHGRREVADAVHAAMVQVSYVVPIWATPNRLALRDALVERWLPEGFANVFFTSGGSESADSALRLTRAYQVAKGRPERWKVAGRHPSYHGITLGAISVASHTARQAGYEPLLLDFPKVSWNDPADVERLFAEHGDELAGFFFEPVTGASGACLVADDEYWRTVTRLCKQHDVLLVSDEVMTGFGRTGKNFGFEHWPIEPDVIYGGKGLGGGYVPMGMVAAHDHVTAALAQAKMPFMFFTFTGGDAMCAGALAVLQIMERESLVERVQELGDVLERRLKMALGDSPYVSEIRGRGLMLGIELVRDRHSGAANSPAGVFAAAVVAEMMARGVWVYPAGSGPVSDGVMIGCPYTISTEEMEELVGALTEAIPAAAATVGV